MEELFELCESEPLLSRDQSNELLALVQKYEYDDILTERRAMTLLRDSSISYISTLIKLVFELQGNTKVTAKELYLMGRVWEKLYKQHGDFLNGDCQHFALALHDILGYPFEVLVSTESDEYTDVNTFIHAYCVHNVVNEVVGVSVQQNVSEELPDFKNPDREMVHCTILY